MDNQEKEKRAEQIYNVLKSKTKSFTREDLKKVIINDGYSSDVADLVIQKLVKNNCSFKDDNVLEKTTNQKENDKQKKEAEKLLQEINQNLKKDQKKNVVKKPKSNPFNKIGLFFKKTYFFFEDRYYDLMDKIDKVVPINKLVDKIDKKFPSFILFLIFIFALIGLIIFLITSGTLVNLFSGSSQGNIVVSVVDVTGSAITGATVKLTVDEELLESKLTDAWGEVNFSDHKFNKKQSIAVTATKEAYNTKTKDIIFNKKQIIEKIVLDINTTGVNNIVSPEKQREIMFLSNNVLIIGKNLDVRLYCSAENKDPSPKQQIVITGKINVTQPANCGDLRIDIYSQDFETINNMVVPEGDRINLSSKNSNSGKLEVTVSGATGTAITDAVVKVFKVNDPTTTIDESSIAVATLATDYYGKTIFNLTPGNYLLSIDKSGYITIPKSKTYPVVLNNTTTANYTLFSIQEINEIDCSNPIYSEFCTISGDLNCSYDLLTPYLIMNPDGTCQLGTLGYIDVTLKDQNTMSLVKGNISLWKKSNDSNSFSLVATRADVNRTEFNVLTDYIYQIRVSGTEQYGYLPPNPELINTLDVNKVIYLEYQSWLNSGDVNVNVKYSGIDIDGATVYLFYGSGDDKDTPYPTDPLITNSQGVVSFRGVRSNIRYYAMSVLPYESIQGSSETRLLDSNETINLTVNLQNQSKILNLRVNTSTYGVSFFDSTGSQITNYVTRDVENTGDLNKEYVFNSNDRDIYAIVSAVNYTTYQTELIRLIPGDVVYKSVILTQPQATPYSDIEFLGLYDESGSIEIDQLNFVGNYNIDREYQLKYKITLSPKQDRDLSYGFIRLGNNLLLNDDFLYIKSVFAPQTTRQFGCRFSGELLDWNFAHFNNNYQTDISLNGCPSNKSKWVKIDFTNADADIIIFTINFKFQNGVTNVNNYKHYYRALTNNSSNYSFSPTFTNWQNWSVKPNGFFYARSNYQQIPFSSSNYSFIGKVYDSNSVEAEINGNSYILYIGDNYNYNTKFLYLRQESATGNINWSSQYTNNNLKYLNYKFLEKNQSLVNQQINNTQFTINNKTATIGYWFDLNGSFSVDNFFSTNSNQVPVITNNILEITNPSPLKQNVRAYSKSDFFIDIITSDNTNQNRIYTGENDINFLVRSQLGAPLQNINIKYCLIDVDNACIDLGTTNSQGKLNNRSVIVPLSFVDSNVTFRFLFDSSYGLENNIYKIKKRVYSGLGVYNKLGESSLGSQITLANKLNFNNAIFTVNGIKETSTKQKDYFIKKDTTRQINLRSVRFILNDGYTNSDLNVSKMNIDVNAQNNPLPRDVSTSLTLIKANSLLNKNIAQNKNFVLGKYENQVNLGNYLNNPIIFFLNADTIINILRINLDTNLEGVGVNPHLNGFNKDTKTLELITTVANQRSFSYSIKNNSNNAINISGVDILKSTQISGNINVEYSLSCSTQGNQANFSNDKKIDDAFYFASGSDVQEHVSPISSICLINPGQTGTFYFTVGFSNENFTNKKEGTISIDFNISDHLGVSIGRHGFTINTNLYREENVLEIENLIPNVSLNCNSNSCESSNKLYVVENKTSTYSLNLESIDLQKNTTAPDYLSNNFNIEKTLINELSTINPEQTNQILINYSAEYQDILDVVGDDVVGLLSLDIERELLFNYKINNTSITPTPQREVIISITVYAENLEQTLNKYGLTSNVCLGSGHQIIQANDDFFIIANCSQKIDCRVGRENSPRILYYWGTSGQQSPVNSWETECVDSDYDYNLTKNHCDSTQMLISIINLIKNSSKLDQIKNNTENYYIYLMADGISKDLLKDFIVFDRDFSTGFINGLSEENRNIFSDQNINDNKLTITKLDSREQSTTKPGKYKISINSDYYVDRPSQLHITLTQVQELPYALNNFLYYLPINGNMGLVGSTQKVHRDNYGVTVDYLDNDLKIPVSSSGNDLIYLYDRNDSQTQGFMYLLASNYTEITDKDDVEQAIKSNRKLLEINLLGIDNQGRFTAELKYSPTYPIPLYALISNSNTSDFSYFVTESINNPVSLDLKANPFITWTDYLNESKKLKDNRVVGQTGNFLNHVILKDDFAVAYGSDERLKLLKTILYLPQPQANTTNYTVRNYHFMTEGANINNPLQTKIFTIGTIDYVFSKNVALMPANNIEIRQIKNLFTAIETENACIYSDPVTTQIRWTANNVDFPTDQRERIINYYKSLLSQNIPEMNS